eukprot:gene2041-3969_t
MTVCCIGPVCIPVAAIWPLLLLFIKPLWTYIKKFFFVTPAEVKKETDGLDEKPRTAAAFLDDESDWNNIIGSKELTIVRFTASWCKPCKRIEPYFYELSTQHSSVSFITIDIDKYSNLAVECGAIAIPLFQAYKQGKLLGKVTGEDHVGLAAGSNSQKAVKLLTSLLLVEMTSSPVICIEVLKSLSKTIVFPQELAPFKPNKLHTCDIGSRELKLS